MVFLRGDAPPHTDYQQQKDYVWAMDEANKRAIKLYTIGASGLNIKGEYIFRHMAQHTLSQFIFLTYGEKGESSGAGTAEDPGKVSHHTGTNYEVNTLDNIIVRIVKKEIAYLVSPNMRKPFETSPESQVEHINDRLYNIIAQLVKQLDENSVVNPTVVVCPVETKEAKLAVLGDYVRGVAIERFIKEKKAVVVEREKLDKLLDELKLGLSGLTEKSQQVGAMLNAGYFIFSSMGYLGDECLLQMRVVDVGSSMVVAAARIRI